MLHSSVCHSTDVSVVMISDVTSTRMCIIKLIQTEEQKRVRAPLPFELHVGLTWPPQKLLFGVWAVLSGLQRASTHTCLFMIHFYYQIIN